MNVSPSELANGNAHHMIMFVGGFSLLCVGRFIVVTKVLFPIFGRTQRLVWARMELVCKLQPVDLMQFKSIVN